MDYEDFMFLIGLLLGATLGAILVVVAVYMDPTNERLQYVCEYEGGEVKDDVCIVDGTVLEIKPSE